MAEHGKKRNHAAKTHSGFVIHVVGVLLLALIFGPSRAKAGDESPNMQSQHGAQLAPSANGIQSGQTQAPRGSSLVIPGAQPSPMLSVLAVWYPTDQHPLPPAPPPLAEPVIPASFVGCWKGNPGRWDERTRLPTAYPFTYNIGAPGEIVFCYRNHTIEVPRADVYISPAKRALDLALNLGLNYNTASAHSTNALIFSISPRMIHSSTRLTVVIKAHLFLLLPFDDASETIIDDENATLVAPDLTMVEGRQVLMREGVPQYSATWHSYFNRITDGSYQ